MSFPGPASITTIVFLIARVINCYPNGASDRLFHALFDDYVRETAPLPRELHKLPISVNISLYLVDIIELVERNQQMHGSWLLSTFWTDERLAWNNTEFNVSFIHVPGELLWLPDIAIFNGQDAENSLYSLFDPRFRARIWANGSVEWYTAGMSITQCYFDATYFPFDDQKCYIHIESVSACEDDVMLIAEAEANDSLTAFQPNEQWTVLNTWVESGSRMCASNLKYFIHLRRKPLFFLINVVMPIIILSTMTLTVFCLPSHATEKVGLAVTVVLSFTVFQLVVAEILPPTSTAPIISIYVFSAMVLSAASLITSVYVLHIVDKGYSMRPSKSLMRLGRVVAQVFCVDNIPAEHSDFQLVLTDASRLKSFALKKIINPSTTCAFNDPDNTKYEEIVKALDNIREEIVSDLQVLTKARKQKAYQETSHQEWLFLATILDRFFFALFSCCNIVLTLLLFLHRP